MKNFDEENLNEVNELIDDIDDASFSDDDDEERKDV